MIIQLDSADPASTQGARHSLATLASSWGHDITDMPEDTSAMAGAGQDDRKVIDPVAHASLVLSIPSSALAALDLADRIRRRRRAQELIAGCPATRRQTYRSDRAARVAPADADRDVLDGLVERVHGCPVPARDGRPAQPGR